jgi:hypothetical protein
MAILTEIAENIWIADGATVSFYGFPYPTRSVIVRLQNGGLWIWSPVELSDELRAEIALIGRPEHLISPNKLHHLFLSSWQVVFPAAALWGPASTVRKCRELTFQPPLTDEPPTAWSGQIDQCWIRGSLYLDEIVFFHEMSRTAILADFSQNFSFRWLVEHWAPWQRFLARLSKIVEGNGYAPSDWRHSFWGRKHLREAKTKILSWNPRRVIMAHGEWQPEGGREFLTRALEWIK